MNRKKRRHEHKATPDQQAVYRDEIKDRITNILLLLPIIQKVEDDMGSGFSAATIGDGRGGGDGLTLVERLAGLNIAGQHDPAYYATEALAEFHEMVGHIKRVHTLFTRTAPMTNAQAAELDAWHKEAEIPICGLCQLPIPDKAHRVDGTAYHANTCYYKVWRSRAG